MTAADRIPTDRFAAPLDGVPASLAGAVVAIGNFDGVHRGHQAVLSVARGIARDDGAPAVVLTFEPHPRTLFRPDQPVFRLTPPAVKARVLAAFGFDGMVVATFDRAFAGQTADAFVDHVLAERLRPAHVVIGYDFHFGKARAGTPAFLAEAGARDGFGVTIVEPLKDDSGGAVSSTRVRDALSTGDVATANALLGWRWQAEGEVGHGDKRGRLLGFPTANIRLPDDCALALGIYAVKVRHRGRLLDGVASFGRRPTFDDGAPLLEVHLFDFSGDLYGETLVVSLVEHLRPELKFASVDALVTQMGRDCEEARQRLAGLAPLSALDAALTFA
jgi:riboflavin kinase/FMN adenylyltransferase